jgi:hypothetical protein
MSRERTTFKSARPHLVALGGYLLLTLVMTYPLVLHLASAIPGDGFDGWQNYWNLWWVKTALLDLHQSPYFTQYLYYPTGYSLLFQTLNIFNSFLTLPVQITLGVTAAYNCVVLFSFVVGGYGAYLLALHVLGRRRGTTEHIVAFLAGVVFTFSPFHLAHLLGHMQVFSLEWLPFFVLCLVRSLSADHLRVRRDVLLPGLFLVLTALCDWYYVLYLLFFTAVYLAYRLWVQRRPRVLLLKTGLILMLSGLVLSPLLVPMVVEAVGESSYLSSPFETTVRLSADLMAFVTPNEFHPLWGEAASRLSESFTSSVSERMVFAGYIPLALGAYAVWARRREAVPWLASLTVFFLLALGPYLHVGGQQLPIPLPYLLLYRLFPFLSIARSVSRFDVMAMLSLAVLTALGLQAALRRLAAQRRTGVSLIAVVLVCCEFLPAPYPLSPVEVPSYYQRLSRDPEEYAILELPMNWDRPAHLLYQTVHHKPIIAGYVTRPNPLSMIERVPVLQQFRSLQGDIIVQDPGDVSAEVLQYLGIRYVILHEYMLPPGREREAVFGLVEEVFGDESPVYEDGQIRVYDVAGQEGQDPFLILGDGWGDRYDAEGGPARDLRLEADLTVVAPAPVIRRFAFTAWCRDGDCPLELYLDGEVVGRYTIGTEEDFAGPLLSLTQGVHTLRLRGAGEGESPLVFKALDLRDVHQDA